MARHPHVGEGTRIEVGILTALLSGDPSRSLVARLLGGVLAPTLFLAYAVRCWATGSARLFGMPGNLAGNEAVAAGIASAAVALFLFAHCFVKRDGVLGWAKDPGKLIALVGVALSIGYVGFRAVAGTMA